MEMQTHEIVRMYKEAADKKKQIVILSQMNLCTPEEIREELVKGGIDPRTLPRKRKQPGEKKAEETTAEPAASAVLIPMADAPLVREALDLIAAWGFKYKTIAFNWVKQNKRGNGLFWGLGNWTRSNSEICLLAIKGKPKRVSASVHSVVMTPLQKHSQKPDEVRDRIVELMGDLPRIELFARSAAEGWDCWGNEAPQNNTEI